MTVRPSIVSGVYAGAIPETTVRGSGSPTSSVSLSSLSALGTTSAARTLAARRSIFVKSSMVMSAGGDTGVAGPDAGADAKVAAAVDASAGTHFAISSACRSGSIRGNTGFGWVSVPPGQPQLVGQVPSS